MNRVSLRRIISDIMWDICDLTVSHEQQNLVPPNSVSMAQARFSDFAWYRAIYADDIPAGFVMLYDNLFTRDDFLWCFMIGHRIQGKGYGRDAMEQLIEIAGRRPDASELETSFAPGPDGPERFFLKLRFLPTDQRLDDKKVYTVPAGDRVNLTLKGS